MVVKNKKKFSFAKLGDWLFLIGILLAIVFAFVKVPSLMWVLVVLGLIVGLLNVTEKESTRFLVATIALMFSAGSLNLLRIAYLTEILVNAVVFVAPAALVVALKEIFALAAKK